MRRRGEQEALNLRCVLDTIKQHAAEPDWQLTESCIKEFNRIALNGVRAESYSAGDYKSHQNLILDGKRRVAFIPPRPCESAALVSELTLIVNHQIFKNRTRSDGALHPVHIAATACGRLIEIHPFAHGNGRTARAVATMVLATFGYTPLPSEHENENTVPVKTLERYFDQCPSDYYGGLHAAMRGNWMIWVDVFAGAVKSTMKWPLP